MRTLALFTSTLLSAGALVVACGGATTTIPDAADGAASSSGGSSSSSGGSSSSGSTSSGGSTSSSGGVDGGDAGPSDCEAMRRELAVLEEKATECCPTCRSLQCHVLTPSVCCPISTTGDKPEYTAAVKTFLAKCGPQPCPAIVCRDTPTNVCEPLPGQPANVGRCRRQ